MRTVDNAILTPHLGYVTDGVLGVFYRETLENVLGYLRGEPRRVLNPDVLEQVDPIFFGDLRQAAFKALGLN